MTAPSCNPLPHYIGPLQLQACALPHLKDCGRGCASGDAAASFLRLRRLCQNSSSKHPQPRTPRQVCSSSASESMPSGAAAVQRRCRGSGGAFKRAAGAGAVPSTCTLAHWCDLQAAVQCGGCWGHERCWGSAGLAPTEPPACEHRRRQWPGGAGTIARPLRERPAPSSHARPTPHAAQPVG